MPLCSRTVKKRPITPPPVDNRSANTPPATSPAEAWKPLPGFEERYQVSSLGNVWDSFADRLVNVWLDSQKGYAVIQTRRYATKPATRVLVRRAVALAFLPNPQKLSWVINKDHNPRNCRVDNLAWVGQDHYHIEPPAISSAVPFDDFILHRLLSEGRMSEAEQEGAGIITALDDSMAPVIGEGVRFVAVPVSPDAYADLMGKVVAVVVKADRLAYYLGRLVNVDGEQVVVSRDNASWSIRTENRSVIAGVMRVVSVLETPVC